MSEHDLSGGWRGIFNYPAGAPPTEFLVELHDGGGTLTGSTREPGLSGGEVTARIEGRRSGEAVSFVKLYDRNDEEYDEVLYAGTLDAEGQEINGSWDIPGVWSGTFIMVRERGTGTEMVAEDVAEVPES